MTILLIVGWNKEISQLEGLLVQRHGPVRQHWPAGPERMRNLRSLHGAGITSRSEPFKKRKHRVAVCYPMFSGGEKKLFITSFVIGNDIIAL